MNTINYITTIMTDCISPINVYSDDANVNNYV